MRFYLSAKGSVCYDRTGITWPEKKPVDLEELVHKLGGTDLKWERENGWGNQPEVLSFTLRGIKNQFDRRKEVFDRPFYPYGLLVSFHWKYFTYNEDTLKWKLRKPYAYLGA